MIVNKPMNDDCGVRHEMRMKRKLKADNNDRCLVSQRIDETREVEILVFVLGWEILEAFENILLTDRIGLLLLLPFCGGRIFFCSRSFE